MEIKQQEIKCCGKEEKLLLICFYIVKLRIHDGCSIYFFLNSVNLICQGTDISKYFRESFGFRGNISRLYFHNFYFFLFLLQHFFTFVDINSLLVFVGK